MSAHYEKYGVLLKPSPQWAIDLFGFEEDHMGDTISHMMWMACLDPAYAKYIPICYSLLKQGKRWPNALQDKGGNRIAKTKIRYGWSKLLHKLKIIKQRLYRTQHGMTRDPVTYTLAAMEINNWYVIKSDPKDKGFQQRWAINQWRLYLITKREEHLKRWERATLRSLKYSKMRQYVFDLNFARALAADSQVVLDTLKEYKPIPNKGG